MMGEGGVETIQASHVANASDDTGDGEVKHQQLKSRAVNSELMTWGQQFKSAAL